MYVRKYQQQYFSAQIKVIFLPTSWFIYRTVDFLLTRIPNHIFNYRLLSFWTVKWQFSPFVRQNNESPPFWTVKFYAKKKTNGNWIVKYHFTAASLLIGLINRWNLQETYDSFCTFRQWKEIWHIKRILLSIYFQTNVCRFSMHLSLLNETNKGICLPESLHG